MFCKKVRGRHAQIELPVVFIFAVIVGVLALGVAGYIVLRQHSSATNEMQLESLVRVRTAIVSLEGVPYSLQQITVPDGTFRYDCDADFGPRMSIDGENEVNFPSMIVFAPQRLSGGNLTVATTVSGDAFKVATMVYLLSPATKIHKDEDWVFPYSSVNGYDEEVVHEYLGRNPYTITMTVEPSNVRPEVGMITFPATGNPPQQVERIYLGEDWLAGAGAAADADRYTCALDRYLQQLAFTTEVQHKRMIRLRDDAVEKGSLCQYHYDERPFFALKDILYKDPNETPPKYEPAKELTLEDAENIASALNNITQMNGRLIRGDRCDTVS